MFDRVPRSMWTAFAALGVACNPAPAPVYGGPPPEHVQRSRLYLDGDPNANLARMRENAKVLGCPIEERSNGTMITCGDVQLWIVPDASGMEITCTGIPANCSKRARELMKDGGDAGAETG